MKHPSNPRFTALTQRQTLAVLRRNHVGRLAFRAGPTVDIQPLGYVASGRWIYLRSADGAKMAALARNPYVAFEADEVAGPFDWQSVVVHGTVYMLQPDGDAVQRREYARALRLMRRIVPGTLTPKDPVPERQHIYGLNVQRLSGRAARSMPRRSRAPRQG